MKSSKAVTIDLVIAFDMELSNYKTTDKLNPILGTKSKIVQILFMQIKSMHEWLIIQKNFEGPDETICYLEQTT